MANLHVAPFSDAEALAAAAAASYDEFDPSAVARALFGKPPEFDYPLDRVGPGEAGGGVPAGGEMGLAAGVQEAFFNEGKRGQGAIFPVLGLGPGTDEQRFLDIARAGGNAYWDEVVRRVLAREQVWILSHERQQWVLVDEAARQQLRGLLVDAERGAASPADAERRQRAIAQMYYGVLQLVDHSNDSSPLRAVVLQPAGDFKEYQLSSTYRLAIRNLIRRIDADIAQSMPDVDDVLRIRRNAALLFLEGYAETRHTPATERQSAAVLAARIWPRVLALATNRPALVVARKMARADRLRNAGRVLPGGALERERKILDPFWAAAAGGVPLAVAAQIAEQDQRPAEPVSARAFARGSSVHEFENASAKRELARLGVTDRRAQDILLGAVRAQRVADNKADVRRVQNLRIVTPAETARIAAENAIQLSALEHAASELSRPLRSSSAADRTSATLAKAALARLILNAR